MTQKWTQACDRRLARLISYIHHNIDYRQYCHVGDTAQHCRLGWFQDSDFAGDHEDSTSTSGGELHLWLSHICTYQLDVQEVNISITLYYRIWNKNVGCWFANVRFTCSWPVGCCNRGIAFDARWCNLSCSQLTGNQNEIKTQTKPEQMPTKNVCRVWTMYLWTHILLMVKLSWTHLKITRQLSKWLSKEGIQRWDMFQEHTELHRTGCSTESI